MTDEWQLTPLDEALGKLRDAVSWNPVGSETVPLDEALGRVAAQPLTSPSDLPPFSKATMDGYAVRAADVAGATPERPALLRLVVEIGMGEEVEGTIGELQCAYLPTGAMMPEGADAVVMAEETVPWSDDTVQVRASVEPGENVLAKGGDILAGEPVLHRGALIRPQEIAVLASLGVVEVPVYRRPRVAIISTGDELVPPEAEPEPGQVREMNGYLIAALCRRLRAEPLMVGIAPDDLDTIKHVLSETLPKCDVVTISGGASVGETDLVAEAIDELGEPGILVHGVAMRPGKPTILASIGGKPVFGLPGHPVSVFVAFRVFVAPLLRELGASPHGDETGQLVTLEADLPSEEGRDDFVPVVIRQGREQPEPTAIPVLGQSAQLGRLLHADGLVHIPAESAGFKQGEQIEVELI